MMKLLFVLVSIFLILDGLQSKPLQEGNDSIVWVSNDAYLKRILTLKDKQHAVGGNPLSFLPLKDAVLKLRGQEIIKTDSNLFVHLSGTGVLYRCVTLSDSTLKFVRIDKTHNINYNNGGLPFVQNENIYILGGYGFWQSNGLLKKFNYFDKEWDIVPISEEIFPPLIPKPGIWHNKKANKIYLLYEYELNDAVVKKSKEKTVKNQPYSLDLKTMQWKKELPLHKKSFELIKNGIIQIQNEKGFFFMSSIDLYAAEIGSNRILKMTDKSVSQSFARVLLKNTYFCSENKLYFKEGITGKLDSLVIPMEKFIPEPFPIFEWSPPEFILWTVIMIILIGFSIFTYIKINPEPAFLSSALEGDQIFAQFSGSEIALIQLLLGKSRKWQKADINELNYVLGVKDKNIGLQKKVRSEAIKSINDKYRYLFESGDGLIMSERSTTDKRYFEYFIPREQIKTTESLLRKIAQ
jgi:hypothetical protein